MQWLAVHLSGMFTIGVPPRGNYIFLPSLLSTQQIVEVCVELCRKEMMGNINL